MRPRTNASRPSADTVPPCRWRGCYSGCRRWLSAWVTPSSDAPAAP